VYYHYLRCYGENHFTISIISIWQAKILRNEMQYISAHSTDIRTINRYTDYKVYSMNENFTVSVGSFSIKELEVDGGFSSQAHSKRCCYIMLDFIMNASQNDVCITQQMCHRMILFRDCSLLKYESSKKI
jgi:hypothetical protein